MGQNLGGEIRSMVGPEVGIEEFRKNLMGILWEFHGNCMYF
jgi:hypothetical protein